MEDGTRLYDRAEAEGVALQYAAMSNQDNRDLETELLCEHQREQTKLIMEVGLLHYMHMHMCILYH